MISLDALTIGNPELIRNLRINLRTKRMGIAVIIIAIICVVILPSLSTMYGSSATLGLGPYYCNIVLVIQSLVIYFGGGIACLQAIGREKELNTFDYQRVTRMTPLELAVGKLLGAPSMAYFIVLCFVPAALLGLPSSKMDFGDLFESYILLLLGSLAFYAFSLMISMLLAKSLSTISVLGFLFFGGLAVIPWFTLIFYYKGTQLGGAAARNFSFYGVHVSFTWFTAFVYASLLAWFLLALVRNIKRDPSSYELYTPLQALVFAVYLNFLMLGFIPGTGISPEVTQFGSIWVNRSIFFALGLTLLRNRNRSRRRLRELGEQGLSWFEAFWPTPILLLGVFVTGFLPLMTVTNRFGSQPSFDFSLFFFRLAFLGFWLSRDMVFLQWMDVRPGRRPILKGFLYLTVYYISMWVLFIRGPIMPRGGELAFQSIFSPNRALLMTSTNWEEASGSWMIALLCQTAITFVFAFLHRQELQSLATRPRYLAPAIPPASAPTSTA